MENSLLAIFDEIWPETMYYSTGFLAQFLNKFKKSKICNFDRNQRKLSTQHLSTCICIRKCNKNGEFSPSHFIQY